MFKQAHIVLSRFLVDEMPNDTIKNHRASLSFGSVMPDMSPRQRLKEHEFLTTWEDTKKRIRLIETMALPSASRERALCRQIGMVFHYLADYFTCPHNPAYGIRLREHGIYEGRQALHLRIYLRSPKAKKQMLYQKEFAAQIHSADELIAHIERMHGIYMQESSHTPQSDCRWVVGVCACAAMVFASMVCTDTGQAHCLYDSVA